ncbi:hypothetical protein Salat_0592500 [Sesamum alatum]|uniref:Uncharacterized protein n=1 Tax=Sesamum alatum TaxID=300844 RepID=A0AAE2CTU8_9LAMI|nr:hypothetical protein Salat_0592500 [Sesamum alatum]
MWIRTPLQPLNPILNLPQPLPRNLTRPSFSAPPPPTSNTIRKGPPRNRSTMKTSYKWEIGEDGDDDFNYDDPIIAELLDKDWDEELAIHRRSPNDKAAHFDIASYKPGNEGDKSKEPEYTHSSNIHK